MFNRNTKPAGVVAGGHRELVAFDWKPHEKNSLKGFSSLSLPSGLVLHSLMLHERNGGRWIGFPAREYLDAAGQKQYARVVEFVDRDTGDKFRDAAVEAVDKLLSEVRA